MRKYDIVVIGSGPAGIAAAHAASKCGASVLLVEKNGYVGGMSTAGFLNMWCGEVKGGLYSKIRSETTKKRVRRWVFDSEAMKTYYFDLLQEANVNLLLHADFFKANVKESHIESISVICAGEIVDIKADIFIDSTGDGWVAKSAGVNYSKGRPPDGLMQPMTLIFMVGGVDDSRAVYPGFGSHPDLEEKLKKFVEDGRCEEPVGHVILAEGYETGTANVNMTNVIRVDGTNPEDLTRAELLTRRQVPKIVEFLRESVPGYENCYLMKTAHTIGVRETLHFEGEYTLTEYDILDQKIFDDWVVSNASYGFGNHNLTGSGPEPKKFKYSGEFYTIPYRSFLAKGVDNLLLNGRNISGTHMAHSSFRVMPICMGMGEGIGACAAYAIKNGLSLREVPVKEVQEILKSEFGVLEPEPREIPSKE